ncbi:heterokaryon incompatibility protein-domain-containing protein [Chaetomium fimeti]|uniref:Heterokaryon incompatibility protein-domain-containing protein n=1 Tax=Chaetomium fimeti TaxID=1854472 RepID=A0AAE0HDD8_9PEZI|nr:heterokaryon incompatibility protein-domain-containing protein [Chaetomium fimeti]
MVELLAHSSVLLGNLERIRTKRDCAGCQSIVAALVGVKEVAEPDLPGLDARLRFDGRSFFCDLYPHRQEPSTSRGPMLWQIEPADATQRLYVARMKYARFMDANRIDTGLISSWIETCDRLHSNAITHTDGASPMTQSNLPFLYLIDLEQECLVRVYLDGGGDGSSADGPPCYVALSYVWGRVEIPTTTTKNLAQLQQPGALSPQTFARTSGTRLTRTIADAMSLASRLGIRFFWTDCFCTVQDGGAEKTMFINAMASIYYRAYFTIVASEGPHGDFGIPGVCRDKNGGPSVDPPPPPRDIICRHMTFPGAVLQTEDMMGHSTRSICEGTPWSTRAWTFQEAFFSRRLLVCNGTVSWVCRSFRSEEWVACEHGAKGTAHETPGFISDVPDWPDMKQFGRLVLEYAKRDLTFDDDVLAAFAGAAAVLSQSFRPGFHFGLPEMFFDVCLLWEGDRRNPRPLRRREGKAIRLPSWSWVSVKGALFLDMWMCFGSHFYAGGLLLPDPRLTDPLVRWRKTLLRPDGHLVPGEYVFSAVHENSSSLISGWSLTRQPGAEQTDYSFSHPTFANKTFSLPFPVLAQEKESNPQPETMYGAILAFTAKRLWLTRAERLERHPWLECPIYHTYVLRDDKGTWAGVLSDDEVDGDALEETFSHGDETRCELIAISKTRVRDWKYAEGYLLEWELDEHPSADRIEDAYDFYNVLWVRWQDQVAYRKGIGRVSADVWDRLELDEVDVNLG